MVDKINTSIPVMFQTLKSYDVEDTRFQEVRIWLMHLNDNLNGSYFSKKVVTEAIPTLANTPILAYIELNSENEKDFSDHREILVIEDNEVKIRYAGKAIGVIPETNNAQFEWRLCDDGIEREFLTVNGLLWTKFDEPIDIINRDKIKSESMEIHEDYRGDFQDDKLFHFSEFKFYGACALGTDVLPAMQNASIEINFSNKDFMDEINEKMEQFKSYSINCKNSEIGNSQEGGNVVDEKLKLFEKYAGLESEKVELLKTDIEKYSLEELEEQLEEIKAKNQNQFALTHQQLGDEIRKKLRENTVTLEDYWGDSYEESAFYFRDIKDNLIIVIDNKWENYFAIPYITNGDVVTIDYANKIPYMHDWRPKEGEEIKTAFEKDELNRKMEAFTKKAIEKADEKFTSKINDLQKKNDELSKTNGELLDYKVNIEKEKQEGYELMQKQIKDDLVENFSKVLTIEEIESVVKEEITAEEMETKFKLLYATKDLASKFTQKPKKKETEVKLGSFNKVKKDDWTTCIKK